MVRRRTSTVPGAERGRSVTCARHGNAGPGRRRDVARRRARPGGAISSVERPGHLDRLEMGPDDAAHRVERRALAVDEHGQVAGGDRGGGHDRAVPRHLRGQGRRVAEEEAVPRSRRVGGAPGGGDPGRPGRRSRRPCPTRPTHRPRPARPAGARAPPRRGAAARRPARAATSQVPSSSSPTGSTSGTYGDEGILVSERGVVHVPRGPVHHRHEPVGRVVPRLGQPEGDAGRQTRRSPGPSGPRDRPAATDPAGSWRPRRSGARGPPRSGCRRAAASTASSDSRARLSRRSPLNGSARCRLRARRANAAQASEPRPSAISSGRWSPGAPCRRRAGVPGPLRRPRAPAATGKMQAPAGADLIGVDEAGASGHGAPEVERGDRRPVRAVAQALVRDAATACRPAARHGSPAAAARSDDRAGRARQRGRRRREPLGGGVLAPAADDSASGRPDAREREHADGDPCRDPVHDRRVPMPRPTSPLRTCATTARTSWAQQAAQATHAATVSTHSASRGSGPPGVPEPARQGDRRPRRRARPERP